MTVQAFPRSLRTLFINRQYAFLWSGQAVSALGDSTFDLTLVVWIAAVIARQPDGQAATWAPLAVSGVLIAVALPSLLFGPIAGVFVDRWDKKATMLWADLIRMLLVTLLVLVSGASFLPWKPDHSVQLIAIYTTVFLASICSQFFSPARAVLIKDIVGQQQLARAAGLAQVSQSIALIMGPPLAAPVLFTFGVQWALLFNAGTFLVSLLCVLAVQAPPSTRSAAEKGQQNFSREFLEGITFSLNNTILRVLLVTIVVVSLGAGAINSLMVFFVSSNLHINVTYVGLLDGSFGIGVIIGALLVSLFAGKVQETWLYTASILGFGVLFLVLARTSNLPIALGIMLLLGLAQATINVTLIPITLSTVPGGMVGRVIGTINSLSVLSSLVSVSLAGYLASDLFKGIHGSFLGFAIGPIDTIFTLSAVLFLLSGFYALMRLRISIAPSSVNTETSLQAGDL
ncbi:MAG TPA: MFS transporter [Ktedonobacteraceae bacterium]|nr:MFS transporter [Ktedonobacteraceae bacterium]